MTVSEINFKNFPTTRYQGSKRKILSWIYANVKDLDFDSCLDAFGGSASVSYLFKRMGKKVTYNDNLNFNYLIGKAIIENDDVIIEEKDIQDIFLNNEEFSLKFISETFKGVYFPDNENEIIDQLVNNIINLNHYPENILDYKKAIAYYSLFQSCLIKRPFNLFHRKNLNIRLADVTRTFGNKTTWEKPFDEFFTKFVKEANSLVFSTGQKCRSINKNVLEIDNNYDLVYLDPPYFSSNVSNETSNYLHCYHFLEGLSKYREWEKLIDFNSINLRFKNMDNEINRKNITENLKNIIEKFRDSIIVISYKKYGIPSIPFIVNTLKKHKKNVYTVSINYNYALNNQNGSAGKNRETLIFGI